MRTVYQQEGQRFQDIDLDAAVEAGNPVVFKGALNDCPLVVAAKKSSNAAMSHLAQYDVGRPFLYYTAGADAKSRFFYTPDFDGFNYATGQCSLNEFFDHIRRESVADDADSYYVGSAELDHHFPELLRNEGLLKQEGLSTDSGTFERHPPMIGIWLGNRTTAATHYDVSNNMAVCAVGKRRFTLFPPEHINHLYPGPLEPTPGGQVVSMVDINNPDSERYPDFSLALEQAQVAELDAGDVLVYPAMWWHQVEALSAFNVLINYWWNTVPEYVDDPMNTLLHALLSLRDRPEHEKKAWQAVFDFYVFGNPDAPRKHLPEKVWGALGEFDPIKAKRLRAMLLNKFNR